MSRSHKIIWTTMEQADFYNAFVAELQERKLQFPLKSSDLSDIMPAARDALKVLKVERRRDITSIDSIRGDIATRLIDNGIFPRNYLEVLRRKPKSAEPEAPDPRNERIAELMNQLQAAQATIHEHQMLVEQLRARVATLERQPTPAQAVQLFVAEIFAKALQMNEDRKKPEFRRPESHELQPAERRQEQQPVTENRRHDPEQTPNNAPRLPKILLVGGGSGHQMAKRVAVALEGRAKFVFWNDESYDMLDSRAKGADMTYILMGAVDHAAALKVAAATKFYQRVAHYSVENLTNMIKGWLEREWQS